MIYKENKKAKAFKIFGGAAIVLGVLTGIILCCLEMNSGRSYYPGMMYFVQCFFVPSILGFFFGGCLYGIGEILQHLTDMEERISK